MGNKESRQIDYILDPAARNVLRENWPKTKKASGDVFALSWLMAIDMNHDIGVLEFLSVNINFVLKRMFGISETEDPMENKIFCRTVRDVDNFFNSLINRHDLKLQACKETCEALGARHLSYDSRGFRTFYWDIFMACLCYSIEEESHLSGQKRIEFLIAWRKFVQQVVEFMRAGYHRQAMVQYPDQNSRTNSTTL